MISQKLQAALEARGIKTVAMLPLAPYSTLRVGGVAEMGIFPESREQLTDAAELLRKTETSFCVIGNGSNVLFGDGVIEGAMIFTKGLRTLSVGEREAFAECGVALASLASAAADASLSGLEFAHGIPGSVGGAVFMNAGAYGGSIADVLTQSIAYDKNTGELFPVTEHRFDYRSSIYAERTDWICLGASFSLQAGERASIRARMRELAAARKEKQPLEYPSAGSYFKRPDGYFAAKLIDDCGLKGYAVGGAAVSTKHAGFIINRGGATARDILRLEEHIREEVFRRFGVMLEREVRAILSPTD